MSSDIPRRKPRRKLPASYHHGDLRRALCDAAWLAVERGGVSALSLRGLADSLGVSHAAPGHHFQDKDALLEELRLLAWTRFAAGLSDPLTGQALALRPMADAYIRFVLANPRMAQLMFSHGARPPSPELRQRSHQAWQLLLAATRDAIGPARAAREGQLAVAAIAAWAQVHGLALLWSEVALPAGLPLGPDAEALRAAALDLLHAGLTRVGE